jgi:DNA helicase II / ATP-dependent DNA helicase PcrA
MTTMRSSAPPCTPDDLRAKLRRGQRELADWQGGELAVSAVPGAGKSTGMAVGAAIAIAQHNLNARRQLMVVTFTRSAAANIKAKIRDNLTLLGLAPQGFQVSTLHGLAWAIARTHLELTELNTESILVTPTQNHRLIRTCVEQWIATNPRLYQTLLEGRQFDGEETERLRRQSVLRTEVLPELARVAIHEAKSSGLMPADLQQLAIQATIHRAEDATEYDVLAIAAGLYDTYQQQLRRRNEMDYDEMILAALNVLGDASVRTYWQHQVFAVFEDEAQDSSPLQTQLLEILATDPDTPSIKNLVRVGDPNQAINSTFTPADPIFFREFCDRCKRQNRLATMTQAGRSADVIIHAANFMLQWANAANLSGSEEPFRYQMIQPVDAKDPQRNPSAAGSGLELHQPADVFQTVEYIGERAIALFSQFPDSNAAVLVRTNEQGRFVSRELHRWYDGKLTIYDVGQHDRQSHIPAEMLRLLQFCDRPHSPDYLKAALSTLVDRKLIPPQDLNALVSFPEQFLYPGPLDPVDTSEPVIHARRYCTSLLRARIELPANQLIAFLAFTLAYDQAELATADKLGDRLSQQTQGRNSLTAIIEALNEIVGSERFTAVNPEDNEERYTAPNQLTVITMHKAKGLDWEFVFIPFLHEGSLPSTPRIPTQGQFLGNFTLAEVTRAQIRAHLHQQSILPDVNTAWIRAQHLKTAEEFRLLYVAMTRAKRLLWLSAALQAPFTWSKTENLSDRKPSPVFLALQSQFPNA